MRKWALNPIGRRREDRIEPAKAHFASSEEKPLRERGDLFSGSCESTYAWEWSPKLAAQCVVMAGPDQIHAVGAAGFDVVSFADHHHLDAWLWLSLRDNWPPPETGEG